MVQIAWKNRESRKERTLATSRTIAIGDIHGCLAALETLLGLVRPQTDDTLVFLGDYIDRGPDTRGVIDRLLDLQQRCRLVPLLGNHDEMLLAIYDGQTQLFVDWLVFGGDATLASYATLRVEDVPASHAAFLRQCRLFFETDRHFFLHGNYLADVPLAQQPSETMLWESLKMRQPGPHVSGKTAIVGHTSQKNGEILDLGYLRCIDTWCYGNGWLTALDVGTGQVWQVNKEGKIRE